LIAEKCDAYLITVIPQNESAKIADLRERRARRIAAAEVGVRGYAIVRERTEKAQEELRRITTYSNPAAVTRLPQWSQASTRARVSLEIIRFQPGLRVRPGRHADKSQSGRAIRGAGVDLALAPIQPAHKRGSLRNTVIRRRSRSLALAQ